MLDCCSAIHDFKEALWHTVCILLELCDVMQSIMVFFNLCYHMDYNEVN